MKIVRKIKFNIFKISNKFARILFVSNTSKKIAIVSSRNYAGKLMEDFYLKHFLTKNSYDVHIVAYEDENVCYQDYDLVIIRSIWGYQSNLKMFANFLNRLKKSKVLVCNDLSLISDNYDKEKQYNLFLENDIPTIDSRFYDSEELLEFVDSGKFVLKPTISASGNNTFKFTKITDINNDLVGRYMIQPFISGIKDGEYSLIYIDGTFSYAIKRFPGVLNSKKHLEFVYNIDKKLLSLGQKVSDLYNGYLFLRVDIIKDNNNYLVLESELLDPSLFFGVIPRKFRKEKINMLIKAIKNKL